MARTSAPSQATFGWSLLPGRVLRLQAPQGARLRAREGQLWVTYERGGDALQDRFLRPGESLSLPAGACIVLGASDARRGLATFDWLPCAAVRLAVHGGGWRHAWARGFWPALAQPA